ncbi:MAG: cytochrome c [Opitutaceae bacterium]|nr:cytochrome c [Opitutaceae bacterium]
MSAQSQPDPRADASAVSDETLMASHAKLLGQQPDEKGRYRLMPLNLLFIFSGMIFFGGTYLGRFSGYFNPGVFNEYSTGTAVVAAAPLDPIVVGKKLYLTPGACVTCHQPNGAGLPGAFPPLVNSEWVTGSEERLIRVALHGLQGPIKVAGVDYNSAMPGFGQGTGFNWSDDKIAAVLTYIRQEWGNKAGPIAVEKVTAVRTKEGARSAAWTAADLEKLP